MGSSQELPLPLLRQTRQDLLIHKGELGSTTHVLPPICMYNQHYPLGTLSLAYRPVELRVSHGVMKHFHRRRLGDFTTPALSLRVSLTSLRGRIDCVSVARSSLIYADSRLRARKEVSRSGMGWCMNLSLNTRHNLNAKAGNPRKAFMETSAGDHDNHPFFISKLPENPGRECCGREDPPVAALSLRNCFMTLRRQMERNR